MYIADIQHLCMVRNCYCCVIACLQALEAREAGIADVQRLLAAPEDLQRLEQLRAEVASKLSSARSALSSSAAAQVEAAKYGLQLLDKSHRHIAKLRLCIDKIDE